MDYDDKSELTTYVWNHFSRFFTPVEGKAGWAVFAEGKRIAGHTSIAEFIWKIHKLAEDPVVMALLADGVEVFRRRTAQRVVRDHTGDVYVNRCPRCNRIVATPKAQQCLWCGHDWHPGAIQRAT